MKSTLIQISLILVLLSNKYYVNTDRIDCIDIKRKFVKVGNGGYGAHNYWYIDVTDLDIETLKAAMGVYSKEK